MTVPLHAQSQSPPDDDPLIVIDGSKTPWEIPNWSACGREEEEQ